jgi:apolipoprotein N-acyltransferase
MMQAVSRAMARRGAWPALTFVLGLCAAAGQAPLGWAWASAFAFGVAIAAIAAAPGWKAAAWRGWAFGTGHFAAALFWIVEPFMVDVARHGWMAPFALLLLAGGLALFWAAAFGAAAVAGKTMAQRAACAVVFVSLAEILRSHVFTGFPWALIGHIWIETPQMQFAAVAGAHGLTLLTLAAVALPTILGARQAILGALAGVALLSAPAGYAWLRVPAGAAALADPPVSVRLVQPNAAQHLKWVPELIPVFFQRQLAFTAALPAEGIARPDLVVWPETAVPELLEYAGNSFAQMAVAAGGARVVTGVQRRDAEGRWFNSLVVLAPSGEVSALYDKHHLVPFGEYMPLMGLFARMGIFGLAANDTGGYHSGPGPRLLDLGPAGQALPLICYEAIFAEEVNAAPARPDLLIQVTNDAWFGELAGPYQHLALARLRAVEQGLPLVRAANTGISAAIDPYGRDLARVPLGEAGFADALLPAPLAPTPYARFGDLPVLALLALAAALIGLGRWRGRGGAGFG